MSITPEAQPDAMDELRRAVAKIMGRNVDTWPDHGNASLAIAATVATLKRATEETERKALANDHPVFALIGEFGSAKNAYAAVDARIRLEHEIRRLAAQPVPMPDTQILVGFDECRIWGDDSAKYGFAKGVEYAERFHGITAPSVPLTTPSTTGTLRDHETPTPD